jgi:hypothetical protein
MKYGGLKVYVRWFEKRTSIEETKLCSAQICLTVDTEETEENVAEKNLSVCLRFPLVRYYSC